VHVDTEEENTKQRRVNLGEILRDELKNNKREEEERREEKSYAID
jgi:hypothetical protein